MSVRSDHSLGVGRRETDGSRRTGHLEGTSGEGGLSTGVVDVGPTDLLLGEESSETRTGTEVWNVSTHEIGELGSRETCFLVRNKSRQSGRGPHGPFYCT